MLKDLERRCKRVRSDDMEYTEEEEYEYYRNKIIDFVEKKRKKFAREDAIAQQLKARIEFKRPIQKKKMKERPPIVSNEVTQRLKEFITNEINGKEAKVVIQKTLYATDLERGQGRLNMPMNQLETYDFLTEKEEEDFKNRKGLEVSLWGPRLEDGESPMVLKIWNMKSTDNYVLVTHWNNFVDANEEDLTEKTKIKVWSFRRENKLCFALICLEGVDGQNDAAPADNV